MTPRDSLDSSNLADAPDLDKRWVSLCDDFVNLEGRCALLCELVAGLSRRDFPLDAASKHGIDMFNNQLREQLAEFKQKLYKTRSEG